LADRASVGIQLLADLTTLRLGGPAGELVAADTEAALVAAVTAAEDRGETPLVLAGGSNVVVADEGFPGTVVLVRTRGVEVERDADRADRVVVTVAAGEQWDELVARAVSEGWCGVEALAGIPGTVGATPIQNVGAYGQEVAQTVVGVRCWDRRLRGERTFTAAECGFGYRTSRFKADPGRHLVLSVAFRFERGELGRPVRYAELANALDVSLGDRAPTADVREAVLSLRRRKGMVLDADDHDTWSVGSFFTNPFVSAGLLPEDAPRWPQPDGTVKASAAWLIEQAGYVKGYSRGGVGLSSKHTLALTNRGAGTTAELMELAGEIRSGVRDRFGIHLANEPVLVGCAIRD
jgi:UDP-N-acetylmuramate dehydrogenase